MIIFIRRRPILLSLLIVSVVAFLQWKKHWVLEIGGGFWKPTTTKNGTVLTTVKNAFSTPNHDDVSEWKWQRVLGSPEKFYVYSAFYDSVLDKIKVIGGARTFSYDRVRCELFYNDDSGRETSRVIVEAEIRTINENWNYTYSAVFVICEAKLDSNHKWPSSVSLRPPSKNWTSPAGNLLRIVYPWDKTKTADFSACVPPFYNKYNNYQDFIEWVEFYRMMGVTHFTFYNHTVGPQMDCVLKNYEVPRIFTVLSWEMPYASEKQEGIRSEAIFVALNDCVYRHRVQSKYLVIVDIDEFIVPNFYKNYSHLVGTLESKLNPKGDKLYSSFSFQNAFFYLEFPDAEKNSEAQKLPSIKINGNPDAEKLSRKLMTVRKVQRKYKLEPHGLRSKYICDPQLTVEAGNHFLWEIVAGAVNLFVHPRQANMHHYRSCENGFKNCTKLKSAIEPSARKFTPELAVRVHKKLKELSKVCKLQI